MGPEAKNTAAEAAKATPEKKSALKSLQDFGSKLFQTEKTEAQTKEMQKILDTQKDQLMKKVEEYKQGHADIIGEGKQKKADLLADVREVMNRLKADAAMPNAEMRGATEATYEALEKKITGTHESVDFKNPDFINKAIANLDAFENALKKATPTLKETDAENNAMLDKIAAERAKQEAQNAPAKIDLSKVETKPAGSEMTVEKNAKFRTFIDGKLAETGLVLPKDSKVTYDPSRKPLEMKNDHSVYYPVLLNGTTEGYVAAKLLNTPPDMSKIKNSVASAPQSGNSNIANGPEKETDGTFDLKFAKVEDAKKQPEQNKTEQTAQKYNWDALKNTNFTGNGNLTDLKFTKVEKPQSNDPGEKLKAAAAAVTAPPEKKAA